MYVLCAFLMIINLSEIDHPLMLGHLAVTGGLHRHTQVWRCGFSGSGNRLISGSSDTSAIVWNMEDPAHEIMTKYTQHTKDVCRIAWCILGVLC
jgi:WD40 repeat protein